MKRTIKIADYDTQRYIKVTAESNASKLDGITKNLESGGVLSDPDCGLGAIKAGLDDVKKSVGDGKKKVAAAIAAKGVTTAADSTFDTLAANIGKIVTLSSGSADANAAAAQILSGYSAYVKGAKVNGSMPSLGAQTITPGTAAKTIAAGRYLSGLQTIAGDANLVAANIKKGVSIFGVAGNYEGDNANAFISGELPYTCNNSTSITITPTSIKLPFKPSILLLRGKMNWGSNDSGIGVTHVVIPACTRFIHGENASLNVYCDDALSLSSDNTISASGGLRVSYQNYGPTSNPNYSSFKWYAIA